MRAIALPAAAAALTLAGCLGSATPLVKDRYAKFEVLPEVPDAAPRIRVSATARDAPRRQRGST